jgi:hypothetical protein
MIDNRTALGGRAGLHALIVGVSEYPDLPPATVPQPPDKPPTFGMRRLTTAATSAVRVFEWLKATAARELFPVSLATCRLLFSPSPAEKAVLNLDQAAAGWQEAELGKFQKAAIAWREDAETRPGNCTLFYFAGHGVHRTMGHQVLLFPGFGRAKLPACTSGVEVQELLMGMAPSAARPKVAKNQLFFFDACRIKPASFAKYEPENNRAPAFWQVEKFSSKYPDYRYCLSFYTTVTGSAAYSIPKGDQTLFSRALLQCLAGGAAVEDETRDANDDLAWYVTANSLNNALQYHLDKVGNQYGLRQEFRAAGTGPHFVIQQLRGKPEADIHLWFSPSEAFPYAEVLVRNEAGKQVKQYPRPLQDDTCSERLPAGHYFIDAEIQPATPLYPGLKGRRYQALPPKREWRIVMGP